MGLANAAVNDEELAAVVDETVQRLAQLSPASLAVTKKAIYCWDAMHFDKGLARAEQIYLEELMKIEVTTVSREENTVAKSAAAVFVITPDMIRRSGATTIPEALRMAPMLARSRESKCKRCKDL